MEEFTAIQSRSVFGTEYTPVPGRFAEMQILPGTQRTWELPWALLVAAGLWQCLGRGRSA